MKGGKTRLLANFYLALRIFVGAPNIPVQGLEAEYLAHTSKFWSVALGAGGRQPRLAPIAKTRGLYLSPLANSVTMCGASNQL